MPSRFTGMIRTLSTGILFGMSILSPSNIFRVSAGTLGSVSNGNYNQAPLYYALSGSSTTSDALLTLKFQPISGPVVGHGSIEFNVDPYEFSFNPSTFPINCVQSQHGIFGNIKCSIDSSGLLKLTNFNTFNQWQIVTITVSGFTRLPGSPGDLGLPNYTITLKGTKDSPTAVVDQSNPLHESGAPTCDAAAECYSTPQAGLQLEGCYKATISAVQYCCPKGSHKPSSLTSNYCAYDGVTLSIKNSPVDLLLGLPSPTGNIVIPQIKIDSPYVGELIPTNAIRFGNQYTLKYVSGSSTIYPLLQVDVEDMNGNKIISSYPLHVDKLNIWGYPTPGGFKDTVYGFNIVDISGAVADDKNSGYKLSDFTPNTKYKLTLTPKAYVDTRWWNGQAIPTTAQPVTLYFIVRTN